MYFRYSTNHHHFHHRGNHRALPWHPTWSVSSVRVGTHAIFSLVEDLVTLLWTWWFRLKEWAWCWVPKVSWLKVCNNKQVNVLENIDFWTFFGHNGHLGPSIKDFWKKSGFLDPLLRGSGLILLKITIGLRILMTPPPWKPDVRYGWPLYVCVTKYILHQNQSSTVQVVPR